MRTVAAKTEQRQVALEGAISTRILAAAIALSAALGPAAAQAADKIAVGSLPFVSASPSSRCWPSA